MSASPPGTRLTGFYHRGRFPGQNGFIGLQVRGRNHPKIGGDDVAALQQDHIPWHERTRIDHPRGAIPPHPCEDIRQTLQRLHRSGSAQLGHKANRGIQQQDRGDGRGLDQIADQQRETCGDREQPDDQRAELMRQKPHCACWFLLAQLVRPETRGPLQGVVLRQAGFQGHGLAPRHLRFGHRVRHVGLGQHHPRAPPVRPGANAGLRLPISAAGQNLLQSPATCPISAA